MMTKEQARDAVKKHGSQNAAAKALGIPRSTFQNYLRERDVPQRSNGIGKSLEDFRATHDRGFVVPRRIRDALKQLGDGWEHETPFAKLAQVSLQELANYRDQFSEHVVVLNRDGRRAWAGTKEVAQKMREMLRNG